MCVPASPISTPRELYGPPPPVPSMLILAAPVEITCPPFSTNAPKLLLPEAAPPCPMIEMSPVTEATVEEPPSMATPWLKSVPEPPVPSIVILATPVEITCPPFTTYTPMLTTPVPAPPWPVIEMLPVADVIFEELPSTATPWLWFVPVPPVPSIVTVAVPVELTSPPVTTYTPALTKPVPEPPWPTIEMLPVADVIFEELPSTATPWL